MAFGDALRRHGNRVVELRLYAIMGGVWARASDLGTVAVDAASLPAVKVFPR
jgi:hypothetical protein